MYDGDDPATRIAVSYGKQFEPLFGMRRCRDNMVDPPHLAARASGRRRFGVWGFIFKRGLKRLTARRSRRR